MTDFAKIERAAVLGCALLRPDSDHDDRAAFLDAMAQIHDRANDALVLVAIKLMQGSAYQMTSDDSEWTRQAMTLSMHLGGSWVEKGKGTGESPPRVIVLLPPPRQ
jgi:hypothetical protein